MARLHPSLPRRRLLGAAALALALVVPAVGRAETTRLVGSGKPATERRELSGYRALHLKADFKVILQPGVPEGVELRGDDNLLSAVETRLVEPAGSPRTLELRWRDGVSVSTQRPVTVIVGVGDLGAIAISGAGQVEGRGLAGGSLALAVVGSGDIELKDLKHDAISAKIAGSGDIVLDGHAASFSASIAGSGDIGAGALEAGTVSIQISGSGDALVNASRSLAVSIAGSGDVRHRGAAEPQVTRSGSGTVRRY